MPVVIGLSILRYGFEVEISSVETLLVVWVVIASIGAGTYKALGSTVRAAEGHAACSGLTKRSLSVVALSVAGVTVAIVTAAQLLRGE
jgi:hypothetical protein